jgi:N4-(beta-N-acetylglucosaminyl)-L-asparaginase
VEDSLDAPAIRRFSAPVSTSDGDAGAAGSTGRGEANLYNLSSFQIVDEMRRGAKPKDACITVLKRIAKNTIEKRLLTDNGQPNFGLNFYCLNTKGEYAGCVDVRLDLLGLHENGAQTLKTESLFGQQSPDGRR